MQLRKRMIEGKPEMAAYAALVSVMHIIEQIQHHPRPPISLDQKQVESLTETITFLQDFLEIYPHNGSQESYDLESRIADAAHAAEDIIESQIVYRIHGGSATSHGEDSTSIDDLYQGLHKVIQGIDLIKKEVAEEIKDKRRIQEDELPRQYSMFSASSSRPPRTDENTMVGFDNFLTELMERLTGRQSNRQIIPIVGMGGIGKTTLSCNVYANPLIVQHFDISGWAAVSEDYNVREILLEILFCQKNQISMEILNQKSEEKLGEILYKSLSGRRYLVVMDDMWSVEVWDKIKFFFPDNNNGSRIMITTRISKLAYDLTGSRGIEMNLLDEGESWNLLRQKVFGEECCPPRLEGIGKKIANNCKGLPLSIIVIGGLLAKSEPIWDYWKSIADNLNEIVNLEDNERCLKILSVSYMHLPMHLKPCFLYMGVFPEDRMIRVSGLIKLWVAEGFLKPKSGESLEMVAEDYLKDLIDRNLILVRRWGSSGRIKLCSIHDLLRDLCLREVHREKFLYVTKVHNLDTLQGINTQRRIVVHQSTSKKEYLPQVLNALGSPSLVRSLIWSSGGVAPSLNVGLIRVSDNEAGKLIWTFEEVVPSLNVRLLRVFDDEARIFDYSPDVIQELVNLRYLSFTGPRDAGFPSSMHLLWNLQTLFVKNYYVATIAPSEIWKMPQLRHVEFETLYLPDPPNDRENGQDDFVLGNLQTLSKIRDFKCGEEVVKRIPNIKKLKISYTDFSERFEGGSRYCLNNLGRLHKLESFACYFLSGMRPPSRTDLLQNITFPQSLKKLTLQGSSLYWEDMSTLKIGLLPHLEVLKLKNWSFKGPEWEPVEGEFHRLKFLLIDWCNDLEYWRADNTHFPCLEHLVLEHLYKLKEVPSGIGDILTLKSILLRCCSDSSVISAKKILEEQEEYENVDLHVRVELLQSNELVESLVSPNFQVKIETCLWEVRQYMDLIMQKVMKKVVKDQLFKHSTLLDGSSIPPPSTRENIMIGFDDVLIDIMDKFTGQQSNRQIIPIVGMGGIGKDESWILFSQKVFGEEGCPPELEEIGMKIANSCTDFLCQLP
ncbi:hypothetical protein BUALT_Bualt07G0160700 [Buddleja alternifolia]|uniref:NB-ARC domain-containing protein n=1 Tax=Buddleja alternifolia TaxID=168488 RepID=A0AAV6XBA5_9LAMI|nr:hypothetical protein BUALT_Bualt07G0160700 [Buddleja alternifolia]